MRSATIEDLQLAYGIYMDETVNPFMYCKPMPLEAYVPLFELRLTRDYFWIFQSDCGTDCAMASAIRMPGRCHHVAENQGVGILQTFLGQGLGKRLLKQIIGVLEKDGITRIQLIAEEDNLRAISLYQQLGFEIEGRQKRAFRRDSGEYIDQVMMAKFLD